MHGVISSLYMLWRDDSKLFKLKNDFISKQPYLILGICVKL